MSDTFASRAGKLHSTGDDDLDRLRPSRLRLSMRRADLSLSLCKTHSTYLHLSCCFIYWARVAKTRRVRSCAWGEGDTERLSERSSAMRSSRRAVMRPTDPGVGTLPCCCALAGEGL